MSEKELPHAVWSGSFNIFGVDVKCHVLSDGERVIEAESMEAVLKAMAAPDPAMNTREQAVNLDRIARWIKGAESGED